MDISARNAERAPGIGRQFFLGLSLMAAMGAVGTAPAAAETNALQLNLPKSPANESTVFGLYEGKAIPGGMKLLELLETVRTTHPAVVGRQADLEAAESGVLGAKLRFLPAPSLDRTTLSGESASIARLEQPLWTGGRLMAGLDGAEAKSKLSAAGLSDALLNLSTRTVTLYQNFLALSGRLWVVDDGLNRLNELRDLVERRAIAGASAAQDVDLARSRIAQLQSERAGIISSRQSVLGQLSQLAGRRLTPKDLDSNPKLPPGTEFPGAEERALDNSPGVYKARSQIDSAIADEKYAQSVLWPTISMRSEYQKGQYEGSMAPGNRWYLVVNYVPGAGLSSIADVAAAKAKIRAAESELETTQREVIDRLQTELDDYESARSRLPDLGKSTRLSIEQIESSKRLFVLGRRSWIDLLNSVRELVNVHQQESDAQAQLLGTFYRIRLLTGDLYPIERK